MIDHRRIENNPDRLRALNDPARGIWGEPEDEKIRVLYVFRGGRKKHFANYLEGQGGDEFLYGLHHFDPDRFQVTFVEGDDPETMAPLAKWRRLIYFIGGKVGIGFSLHIVLGHLDKFKAAQVVLTPTDTCGLPVAWLKRRGIIQAKLVYISQGLTDRLDRMSRFSPWRSVFHRTHRWLLGAVDRLLVVGEGATEPLERFLDLEPGSVGVVPFGVDTEFWSPAEAPVREDYLLSIGSDQGRDYPTLLKATDRPTRLVTRLAIPPELKGGQVEVGSEYTDLELREMLRRARLVIVPLQDITQPSGQSSALQAMACSRPVILTRTRGLWERARMVHGRNCWLVEPGDPEGLGRAIEHLWANPGLAEELGREALKTAREIYDSRPFAARLEAEVDRVRRPGEKSGKGNRP